MSASLVGSEMCIRDRAAADAAVEAPEPPRPKLAGIIVASPVRNWRWPGAPALADFPRRGLGPPQWTAAAPERL
eukprot:1995087-Alexandrium_andersonii.AAC.1